jgi:hypothetical protein
MASFDLHDGVHCSDGRRSPLVVACPGLAVADWMSAQVLLLLLDLARGLE